MSHVFISYVRENGPVVDRLAAELREVGIDVWLDRDSIAPGEKWAIAIERAIREGAFFLACFSKEYSDRSETHMDEELSLAGEQLRQRPEERAWFIPVILAGGTLPKEALGEGVDLSAFQWVDLETDWDEGFRRLVGVILDAESEDDTSSTTEMVERARSWKHADRLARQLLDPVLSVEEKCEAAERLGSISPPSRVAIDALRNALLDEELRLQAVEALASIGEPAAEALIEAGRSLAQPVRRMAFRALREIGPCLADLIAPLLELAETTPEDELLPSTLSAPSDASLTEVLTAVGESAVPDLLDAALGGGPGAAKVAPAALAERIEEVVPTAERIFTAIGDRSPAVRSGAIRLTESLAKHDPELVTDEAVESLAQAMEDLGTRIDAYRAFMALGDRAVAAISILVATLKRLMPEEEHLHPSNRHRMALRVLRFYIGAAAIPELLSFVEDFCPKSEVEISSFETYYRLQARFDAIETLSYMISADTDDAILDRIRAMVEDDDEHIRIRCAAAVTLVDCNATSPNLLAVLEHASRDNQVPGYKRAAEALQKLKGGTDR